LLTYVQNHPSDDVLVAFHTNRALYFTGRLSSDMFSFNQSWGIDGLFLPSEMRKFFSMQLSDLYWDMGLLNEAQHWVLEDHSNFSFSPWHLQRLTLISIVRGNSSLATMCLNALDKTILYRDWVDHYRPHIEDPQYVVNNTPFGSLKDLKFDHDFIVSPALPEQDIPAILAQHPGNRMAFEYLMAGYMLTFRLGLMIADLQSMDIMNRSILPRSYQEAIMVFIYGTTGSSSESVGQSVQIKTRAQFSDFMKILQRYKGDATAAQHELKEKYGETYWYYSLYNNPNARTELF
jgi:hypothetical protein